MIPIVMGIISDLSYCRSRNSARRSNTAMQSFNLLVILCVVLGLSFVLASKEDGPGRGWGDNIAWKTSLEDGIKDSKESGKPMFLVIHKSWCGACKRLAPLV